MVHVIQLKAILTLNLMVSAAPAPDVSKIVCSMKTAHFTETQSTVSTIAQWKEQGFADMYANWQGSDNT